MTRYIPRSNFMSARDDVGKTSQAFYAALNRMLKGDTGPLAEVWSHSADVTTMHPVGGRDVGWDGVKTSFEQVAKISSGGHVELRDQRIQVAGDMAYEVGTEAGQAELAGQNVAIEQRVTNVYRQEGGTWKIVHHHTDLSAGMLDVLHRLQTAT
ncbi:MAG: nuclear transport factor 2 family protein [Candidatus Elarobacter sp.]